jgi:hypothetical protein
VNCKPLIIWNKKNPGGDARRGSKALMSKAPAQGGEAGADQMTSFVYDKAWSKFVQLF